MVHISQKEMPKNQNVTLETEDRLSTLKKVLKLDRKRF